MSNSAPQTQSSVLDRLIDDDPENTHEVPMSHAQTMRDFRAAVRRDLEWLLNTRFTLDPPGEEYEHLEASMYIYGLPDFVSYGAGQQQTRARLMRALRRAIELFEPRIMDVEVTAADEDTSTQAHDVRFLISGLLRVDPAPEAVTFDTRLEIGKNEYKVREA